MALVDHRDAALQLQYAIAVYLRNGRLDGRLHLALDLHHQSLDGDSGLIDLDAVPADLQFDPLHGLGRRLAQIEFGALIPHRKLDRLVALTERDLLVPALQFDGLVALGERRALVSLIQGRALISLLDGDGLIAFRDGFGVVGLDRRGALVLDVPRLVVLDDDREILLSLDVNFLGPFLVLEAQLIEIVGATLGRAAGLDARLRLIRRERIRWHLV